MTSQASGDAQAALRFFTMDHSLETLEQVKDDPKTQDNITKLASELLHVKPEEFTQVEPSIRASVISKTTTEESQIGPFLNLETAIEVANKQLVYPATLRQHLFSWNGDHTELTVEGKSKNVDLTSKGFFELAKTLSADERTKITSLKLDCRGFQTLEVEGNANLASLFPNLERLDLSGLGSLTSLNGLQDLKLKHLDLTRCTGLRDVSAVTECPLVFLSLAHCQSLPKDQMEHVEQVQTLQALDLSFCPGLRERVIPVALLSNLTFLSLKGNGQVTSLRGFEKAARLEKLDISRTGVESLSPLSTLRNLSTVIADGSRVPPKELEAFKKS